jgi:transcriptional regulator with XRE-family HTH domain
MADTDSDLLAAIAETCKAIRENADQTRTAFARAYDLDESMISMFERGRRQPKNVEAVVAAYADLGNRTIASVWSEISESVIAKQNARHGQAAQRNAQIGLEQSRGRDRKQRPG